MRRHGVEAADGTAAWIDRFVVDVNGLPIGIVVVCYGDGQGGGVAWLGIDVGGLDELIEVLAPCLGARLVDGVVTVAFERDDVIATSRSVVSMLADAATASRRETSPTALPVTPAPSIDGDDCPRTTRPRRGRDGHPPAVGMATPARCAGEDAAEARTVDLDGVPARVLPLLRDQLFGRALLVASAARLRRVDHGGGSPADRGEISRAADT